MKVTNMLAKAQFDNKADSPDELTFRKGDILTVLEQNIPGSEGWWRCYLHGRQGLVPANRLQLFTITKNDASSAQTHYGTLGRQQSQQNIYQVPSAPKITNLPTYEQMDSVYIVPLSPKSGDLYQTPVSSPAQIYYEKANSTTSQHLFTLPRASRVSNPASVAQAEVYDVPPSVHSTPPSHQSSAAPSPVGLHSPFSTSPEQTQQQIYDIPASTDTPGRRGLTEIYDIPPSGKALQDKKEASLKGCYYNTLPPPRKSDWIYDVPMSPEKKDIKTCRKISLDRQMVYDVPPTRYGTLQTNSEDTCVTSQIYNVPPLQKTSPVACQPVYNIPPSLDLGYGSMKKNTSNIWKQRVEKLDSKENVYDIPRGSTGASLSKTELASPASDKPIYEVPPPLPRYRNASLISAEIDRLSISSSESCTSTLSSSSSASDESFTMSSLEVSIKQETLELDEAIKEITQLQDRLSSSIASLMIFVSSKWRLQEHMVANLEDIHKAVDSIIASLKAFLDFAQRIRANASQLKDSNIQLRIKTQLQTLTDSFQMLSHNQEAIDRCNWSMQALVIDKPHTTPDDLDRFVMVARTIPDDIKRFVSIIIANGKLLFRKREEQIKLKEEIMLPKPQVLPQKETDVGQQSACVNKAENARQRKHPLPRQKTIEDSDYVHLQKKEEFERAKSIFSHQQLENTTKTEEKRKGWIKPERLISGSEKQEKKDKLLTTKEPSTLTPKQDTSHSPESPKKFNLSEHSCLYFGALQKAIGVFNNSLNNNQPPEIFITHGKLIIMVGQKLVDSVCQDVKTSEVRNDVLFKSSELCGLLNNLALATKTAAIQYPNPAALRDMEMRMDQLLKHTQIFRAMAE
ncbi:Cas scaffold protein family member 4 L homeolog [Xenopus laevis]|uniref:Cas scaffold protein family member 4 L homeolog n=1 Tax=Xenopus laevis TaxID=8355 RepID=Q6RCJ1_XENLA|nr:Cas scaffold protein family member 4 L homeolog [Xenopus laevis]AAS48502.1 Cas/HEF-like protein 1 [Xenopus laevis]